MLVLALQNFARVVSLSLLNKPHFRYLQLLLSRTTVDSNFFYGPIEFEITRVNCIIKRFREAGTVENRPRSGRPRAMDDSDYRQLEKIVKNERRAPLVEITAKFN